MRGAPIRQRGAALVVGLVMLVVLTLLAVSTMNTSTLQVTMAGNTQFSENAFQAAETGIDLALAQRNFNTTTPSTIVPTAVGNGTTEAVTTFEATTPVPDGGFSIGVGTGGYQAFHFDTTATGTAARDASSEHTQSFYVVGPGGS
jgi:type IV pilus assembly protein PilX